MGSCIPARWKKIAVLVQFGLRDLKEVESSIQRYDINDIRSLEKKCLQYIHLGINMILIAVPIDYERKLPNFYISSKNDLLSFFRNQYTEISGKYSQIWCCPQSNNGKKFFARFMLLDRQFLESAILEVVFASSARKIDEFDGNDDYISQRIDILMGTAENTIVSIRTCSREQLVRIANMIREYLSDMYERIFEFSRRTNMIGEKSLCLELVCEESSCCIIDFDTYDDERVIQMLWRQ